MSVNVRRATGGVAWFSRLGFVWTTFVLAHLCVANIWSVGLSVGTVLRDRTLFRLTLFFSTISGLGIYGTALCAKPMFGPALSGNVLHGKASFRMVPAGVWL